MKTINQTQETNTTKQIQKSKTTQESLLEKEQYQKLLTNLLSTTKNINLKKEEELKNLLGQELYFFNKVYYNALSNLIYSVSDFFSFLINELYDTQTISKIQDTLISNPQINGQSIVTDMLKQIITYSQKNNLLKNIESLNPEIDTIINKLPELPSEFKVALSEKDIKDILEIFLQQKDNIKNYIFKNNINLYTNLSDDVTKAKFIKLQLDGYEIKSDYELNKLFIDYSDHFSSMEHKFIDTIITKKTELSLIESLYTVADFEDVKIKNIVDFELFTKTENKQSKRLVLKSQLYETIDVRNVHICFNSICNKRENSKCFQNLFFPSSYSSREIINILTSHSASLEEIENKNNRLLEIFDSSLNCFSLFKIIIENFDYKSFKEEKETTPKPIRGLNISSSYDELAFVDLTNRINSIELTPLEFIDDTIDAINSIPNTTLNI